MSACNADYSQSVHIKTGPLRLIQDKAPQHVSIDLDPQYGLTPGLHHVSIAGTHVQCLIWMKVEGVARGARMNAVRLTLTLTFPALTALSEPSCVRARFHAEAGHPRARVK